MRLIDWIFLIILLLGLLSSAARIYVEVEHEENNTTSAKGSK